VVPRPAQTMARLIIFAADLGVMSAREISTAGIRWGTLDDMGGLVATGVDALWLRLIDDRAPFAVMEEDGRVIGFTIFMPHEKVYQYRWLVLRLRPHQDVFSTGAFVIPERRGGGITADIKSFAARHYAGQGYRRMVSVVNARNTASIRAHRRVGAAPLGTLRRARIGDINMVWQHGRLPQIGRQPFVVTL
jgi:L-amino acid N-acyltransferase YncA